MININGYTVLLGVSVVAGIVLVAILGFGLFSSRVPHVKVTLPNAGSGSASMEVSPGEPDDGTAPMIQTFDQVQLARELRRQHVEVIIRHVKQGSILLLVFSLIGVALLAFSDRPPSRSSLPSFEVKAPVHPGVDPRLVAKSRVQAIIDEETKAIYLPPSASDLRQLFTDDLRYVSFPLRYGQGKARTVDLQSINELKKHYAFISRSVAYRTMEYRKQLLDLDLSSDGHLAIAHTHNLYTERNRKPSDWDGFDDGLVILKEGLDGRWRIFRIVGRYLRSVASHMYATLRKHLNDPTFSEDADRILGLPPSEVPPDVSAF